MFNVSASYLINFVTVDATGGCSHKVARYTLSPGISKVMHLDLDFSIRQSLSPQRVQ